MAKAKLTPNTKFLPAWMVAERYGVHPITLDRWLADPRTRFPAPTLRVNMRRLWAIETLEAWERLEQREAAMATG